ncbi:poly(R)-hydroxyalkanoic acid synthase subunit PhaE [Rhodanobacter sp. AS-Z3]|uniref:poly(R)-hydroxyalkanoic acid synthase subunit PhaE n=1 Tax=Rhodanobacter sp. AS-Z3 TaxID=3031330 RepID=UPI002478591E|nr:poly(R)-hydroxyalkanoic acid synthase subunit PhaE [Rhodanobacter sp. AS-Z3]WEN13524.1 poly(R)-hydroxyalkanoic acid synthase subunit PhaE [Rhodanobacter sp. AS-Z3]
MADPASDFMKDYQALAQQSWDSWTRQLQQQPAANPFAPPPSQATGGDTLERTLAGLKGYFDWMQNAASSGVSNRPSNDWQQQLQQMFGGASQPFAQAFGGIDSAGAQSFARQWQSWSQAAQRSGFGDMPGAHGPTPAFGMDREQQMQQQELGMAMLASMQASAKYQELIQRANTQGMQRLQQKLAEHAAPGRQVDSLKGLYDLWVDASEEAYAGIALSDEFRVAYGEMVNTQMRVRQLQQKQTEQLCQQLGVPTRSEVSSLGERLQALRREFRASQTGDGSDHTGEIMALRREVAALKRQLGNAVPAKPAAKKAAPARAPVVTKKSAPAKKPAAAKKPAPAKKPVAAKKPAAAKSTRKSAAASKSTATARKRK